MNLTYLMIDAGSILFPLVFSFHPRLAFYKDWKAIIPALAITGIFFLIWDAWFTQKGVWGFNPHYLVGMSFGNLPLEEILFFLCIPYACVFTYACLDNLINYSWLKTFTNVMTGLLIFCALMLVILFHAQWYTCTTFLLSGSTLLLSKYVLKVSWLGKFYVVYAVLLVPFMIVNGILTGTGLAAPIVWYNGAHIMGPRILTIPLEDVFYGMALVLINLLFYKYFKKAGAARNRTL